MAQKVNDYKTLTS